jgi:alkylation response protein AidB-like acyl-CoA dehydrogenase
MDLMPSAEQEAVRDAIRGMLRDRMPPERVRAVMAGDAPVDRAFWRQAAELGWLGLALPESAGGAGYGLPEAMLLFVELGRALAPGPFLGSVIGAQALQGTKDCAAVLDGSRLVGLVDDPADALGTGATLDGAVSGVVDADLVDAFVVLGSRRVAVVDAKASGLSIAAGLSMDPTRRLGTVTARGVRADALDAEAAALRRAATVLVSAEAVGVAERTVEMSVEFSKVRQQFGKPIGTFQAIKHRCADMATRTEVARAVVVYASVAVGGGEPDADFHVHSAKALATDAAIQNATDNVQNHGGMGYTWESDAHLYLKRARVLEHVGGSRFAHLDAIAAPWRAAR